MSFKLLPYGPDGSFSIGVYEVTQQQYEAVMGSNPSEFKGANNPVEQVDWYDAVAYCAKLSSLPAEVAAGHVYRLPTEAEWQHACRAGTTTQYSFGGDEQDLGKYAWFDDNSGRTTHAVGEKLPNGWGLYDMHGNVWEWCSDAEGSFRVPLGGSWFYDAANCRTAIRNTSEPSYRSNDFGFRLALSSQSGVSSAAEQVQGK
jgi:formylglycine-generating enzyme required for sulfatase activity